MRYIRIPINSSILIGFTIISIIICAALSANIIYPLGPYEIIGAPFQPPLHGDIFLGTDMLGRNIATGLLYGARVSLFVGLLATALITVLGLLIGGIAGYFGGIVDALLLKLIEFFQTIPSFIGAIVIVAVFGSDLSVVIIAIAIVSWAPMARLVRGEVMQMRETQYVESCKLLGMSSWNIILVQLIPNVMPVIVVAGSLMIATAILFEAGLSFLGLTDPNVMSWGQMIGAGRGAMRTAWWIVTIPGIAIALTVLGINLLGDGLNAALRPKQAKL